MRKITIEIDHELEAFIKEYMEGEPIEKAAVRLLELVREKIDKENNEV